MYICFFSCICVCVCMYAIMPVCGHFCVGVWVYKCVETQGLIALYLIHWGKVRVLSWTQSLLVEFVWLASLLQGSCPPFPRAGITGRSHACLEFTWCFGDLNSYLYAPGKLFNHWTISPDRRSLSIVQTSIELLSQLALDFVVFLPLILECWEGRLMPSSLASSVLLNRFFFFFLVHTFICVGCVPGNGFSGF